MSNDKRVLEMALAGAELYYMLYASSNAADIIKSASPGLVRAYIRAGAALDPFWAERHNVSED